MYIEGRVCSLRLFGDAAQTVKWVTYAKVQLTKWLRLHGKMPTFSCKLTPARRVIVEIGWYTPDECYIRISCLAPIYWMETGFAALGGINYNAESWYRAANVYYYTGMDIGGPGKPQGQITSTGMQISDMTKYPDGFESEAIGDLGTQTKYADVTTPDLQVYHSDPAAYLLKVGLRHSAQTLVPPSFYTGKLRLMVQALYGSTRATESGDPIYSVPEWYPTIGYPPIRILTVLGVQLLYGHDEGYYHSGNTSGLMTVGDRYFVINIYRGVNIQAREWVLSKWGKDMIRNARANFAGAQFRRYEAYALQTGSWATDLVTIENAGAAVAMNGYGVPLAYGWKFNWNGTKASVVYNTEDAGARLHYSTICHLNFEFVKTEAGEKIVVTSSVEAENTPFRWYPAHHMVYAPFSNIVESIPVFPSWATASWAPYTFTNVAIYGWYDNADNFITVRLSDVATAANYAPPDTGSINTCGGLNGTFTDYGSYGAYQTLSLSVGTTTFSGTSGVNPAEILPAVQTYSTGAEYFGNDYSWEGGAPGDHLCDGRLEENWAASVVPPEPGGLIYWVINHYVASCNKIEDTGSHKSYDFKTCAIVPLFDAEAFTAGWKQSTSSTGRLVTSQDGVTLVRAEAGRGVYNPTTGWEMDTVYDSQPMIGSFTLGGTLNTTLSVPSSSTMYGEYHYFDKDGTPSLLHTTTDRFGTLIGAYIDPTDPVNLHSIVSPMSRQSAGGSVQVLDQVLTEPSFNINWPDNARGPIGWI